ncbi:MAG: AAA family ATPase, partial [Methanobrevibacter sp.]|nr:AAA family ATPase [Candidatus Methanovirga aequatorialis]
MKKLPIGIQTFSEIREEGYLYVDKTKYIHELIKEGKIYFLSRPRRFGKSLLLSTIEELFKGNKELFNELYIYDKWDWSKKYPIIHLDLSKPFSEDNESFKESLSLHIDLIAETFSIKLNATFPNDKLTELIYKVHKEHDEKVVVLVDEYDLPILDSLNNQKVLEANEKVLESFYRVLKTNDRYIKFIFITGISKFAHVSVFSTLNNTDDITLIDEYNSICGYT